MTQLPRYKPGLDSTYLKVNGTYFKIKYILTCPQNIILVDLTSYSYYAYSSTISYIDTLSTHMVGLHNNYSSFVVKVDKDYLIGMEVVIETDCLPSQEWYQGVQH